MHFKIKLPYIQYRYGAHSWLLYIIIFINLYCHTTKNLKSLSNCFLLNASLECNPKRNQLSRFYLLSGKTQDHALSFYHSKEIKITYTFRGINSPTIMLPELTRSTSGLLGHLNFDFQSCLYFFNYILSLIHAL